MRKKRQIASWILLAVFVPMMMLSSFHTHHTNVAGDKECVECVHHNCSGHIVQGTDTIHHCVLCQFLNMTFCAAAIVAVICSNTPYKLTYAQRQSNLSLVSCGFISLRAPPYV